MADRGGDLEDTGGRIMALPLKDPQFRKRLISNPREAIEAATGVQLPQDMRVKVIEGAPNTLYIVLPRSREEV